MENRGGVIHHADTVSVVIPTKNRRALVQRAVASVLRQREVNVQVVVIDDGSLDGTADAIAMLGDDRVQVVRHEASAGVSAARNSGLALAEGRWLALLDDDDLWAPDKLTRQLTCLSEHDASWCYTGAVMVDPDLRILHAPVPDEPDDILEGLLLRNRLPAGSSNVVVDRQLVVDVGGFDASLSFHEDWDLWIRISQQVGAPVCVSAPLVAFTLHEHNATIAAGDRARVDRLFADLAVIEERYAHLRRARNVDRAMVWRWLASQYFRSGRHADGLRAIAKAGVMAPQGMLRFARPTMSRATGDGRAYEETARAWLEVERRRAQPDLAS